MRYSAADIQGWIEMFDGGASLDEISRACPSANRSSIFHYIRKSGRSYGRGKGGGRPKKYGHLTAAQVRKQYWLNKNYGLTLAEFDKMLADKMLADQSGLCAICHQPPTEKLNQHVGVRGLHVDHDHSTGKVRALLCTNCNGSLGKMGDDPARLRAAADYIEFHQSRNVGQAA